MALNKTTGNMYGFNTHTWNTIKGKCSHDCSYCYMKRWGEQKAVHFDEKELRTDLGFGNFIFIGSSCDMFAKDIPDDWIWKTIAVAGEYRNKYLLQTKNPGRYADFFHVYEAHHKNKFTLCTTIETNWYFPGV
jgi:DNA repair photolyase